jgi:hypothetical protein
MNPVEEYLAVSPKVEEKTAAFGGELLRGMKFQGTKPGAGPGGAFANVLGNQLTAGAAIGAVTLGGEAVFRGARKLVNMGVDKWTKPMDYKAMLAAHPELAQEDASKVQALYNSLRHMSPHMSKDPVIAGSFIRNLLNQGNEGSVAIPMDTAKMLADTQKSMLNNEKMDPSSFSAVMKSTPIRASEKPKSRDQE